MAPKVKFTKEEIVAVALSIAEEKGFDAITARAVAEKLQASSKVIFGWFHNMDDLIREVGSTAYQKYLTFTKECIDGQIFPPYKASGMAYIRFATVSPHLFRFLFMRDRTGENTAADDKRSLEPIAEIITQSTGLPTASAFAMHQEMWLFVHGIASTLVTGYLSLTEAEISEHLSTIYFSLLNHYKKSEETAE